MKNLKYKYSFMLVAALFLGGMGCKKDFLDVNDNPNNPESIDVKSLLPSAELAIAHTVGNNFQQFGGMWGQYWTQSPASSQYKTTEQYSPSASDFDRPWRILYADALTDLRLIQKLGAEKGNNQYAAIARIMEGYAFQLLTDNWGDIPYDEALQGEAGILSPHYNTQEVVYNQIIATTRRGIDSLTANDPIPPAADDIFFNGDMDLWRKFGNTLLLKMYLRLSEVQPSRAQAGIDSLVTDGADFLAAGEDVLIHYTTQGGNTHPYFSVLVEIGGTQNLVASSTCLDTMNSLSDPRADVFYFNAGLGGIEQGNYLLPASTQVAFPGDYTGARYGPTGAPYPADVRLMSGYESLFLQSEAVARGWMAGDAEALYNEGIMSSFDAAGFADHTDTLLYDSLGTPLYMANTAVVFPAGGSTADKIKSIITQKWFAMCGTQGDEAWIEWRRTGYPDFFHISFTSIAGPGVWPYRMFYPSSEVTRNLNFPGQKLINDRVWWDIN